MRILSLNVIAIIAIAAFAPLFSQDNTTNNTPNLAAISKLAKDGLLEKAQSEADAYINKKPNESRAYKIRAHILFAQKKYNDALADFNKVVELSPKSANALVDRAGVYFVLEDYDNALADIEAALQLKPNSAFALLLKESILEAKNPPKSPSFRARSKGEPLKK